MKNLLTIFAATLGAFLFSYAVFAFDPPTASPPGGNVEAPINVGSDGQIKIGGLTLNTGGATNGLIVYDGNVGIGITTPAEKLTVAGTIESTSGGFKFPDGSVQSSAGGGSPFEVPFEVNASGVANFFRYWDGIPNFAGPELTLSSFEYPRLSPIGEYRSLRISGLRTGFSSVVTNFTMYDVGISEMDLGNFTGISSDASEGLFLYSHDGADITIGLSPLVKRFGADVTGDIILDPSGGKTVKVFGDFTVSGSKSGVVDTQNYGTRKLYSFEQATPRFGDEGGAMIENGEARVNLDLIFLETVEKPFFVHLTPYGNMHIYIYEIGEDYFVVKSSDENASGEFFWMLTAPRKNYETIRLEKVE